MKSSRNTSRALSLVMTLWIASLTLVIGLILSSLATESRKPIIYQKCY